MTICCHPEGWGDPRSCDGAENCEFQRAMENAQDTGNDWTRAKARLDDLTPDQLRAALMCVWVEDPDRFYAVVKAAIVKAAGVGA